MTPGRYPRPFLSPVSVLECCSGILTHLPSSPGWLRVLSPPHPSCIPGGGLRAGSAPSLAVPSPSWCHMLARGPCPAVPSAGTEAGAGASELCISWYDWNYIHAPFPAPSWAAGISAQFGASPAPVPQKRSPQAALCPAPPSPGSHPASATLRGARESSWSRAVPQAQGLHSG